MHEQNKKSETTTFRRIVDYFGGVQGSDFEK